MPGAPEAAELVATRLTSGRQNVHGGGFIRRHTFEDEHAPFESALLLLFAYCSFYVAQGLQCAPARLHCLSASSNGAQVASVYMLTRLLQGSAQSHRTSSNCARAAG